MSEGESIRSQGGYDELSALYRIATLSTAYGNPTAVVEEILRVIEQVVHCDRSALFLYDEHADVLRLQNARDRGLVFPLSEPTILRRVFHSGLGEVVNDVDADAESNPVLADQLNARQLVAAPLVLTDKTLGVVGALNSRRGAFTHEDLRLLTVLADRVALTIENGELVGTLQRQVQELEGLHRLSRLLLSSETMERIVGESIRIVAEMLDCEKMALLLNDESGRCLVAMTAAVGLDVEQVEGLRIPLDEPSLAATVFRTKTPLVSNDAPNDAWVNRHMVRLLGIESLLAVPLTTGPKPIGVLKAMNARKRFFSDDDVRFAMLLGGQVGALVESSMGRQRERQLVQKLREADRTKSEFVSMLAHELKGPMTTIMGFSETLKQQWGKVPDEKKLSILDIIAKETGRLSRLVNDLLDVSRMEAGTLRYDLSPISLAPLIDSIITVHTSLSAQHLVVNDIPSDLPPVLGDNDRLRQVFINLLTNAIRYSPEGTAVRVSARELPDDGKIEVSVVDEGIGISDQDRDRIFSKFSMLPKPGWVKKGTGLGLFITKGIVEAHGGRIWVESEPGKGSTFAFTLQVAPQGSAQPA
ncbi:MAG: GAF domain-containing sensor histidine kinase [Actinomycetota bacterium]|nr:GAF domain-containing sensor histidine kinase [Actinomycetota bacterium]